MNNLAVLADDEFARLDDCAAWMIAPPRSHGVSVFLRYVHGNRESGIWRGFSNLVGAIDTAGNDLAAKRFDCVLVFFQAGQLPAAIGSPVAAIENRDQIFRIDIGRDGKTSTPCEIEGHGRKGIP